MKRVLVLALLLPIVACRLPPRRCENPDAQPKMSPRLERARQAAYDKNYDLAIQETWDIIKYRGDPDEAMAWAIRGSTYYLMGKNSKAKSCWKRAYDIDPCMKEIPGLLEKLETKR